MVLSDIEEQLIEALPKMAEAANNMDLKEAFRTHLDETRGQAVRLQECLKILADNDGDESEEIIVSSDATSDGMKGIISDGEWLTGQEIEPTVLDVMIASAARYAEHYEMAGYMAAIALASTLEESEIVDRLSQTLVEEENADDKLEDLTEMDLIPQALDTEDDDLA